jgi:DNA-binding MarR family transcriptional regulator
MVIRTLQQELKQSKPFDTPADEALVALMRTASLVRRAIGQRVEAYGISPAQYNVLRILRGAGPDGLPTLVVRERLIEEAPGITRVMDKLEEAGHVSRKRAKDDRRVVHCVITDQGLRLLTAMDVLVRETAALISAGLPNEAEQQELILLLAKVRAGLSEAAR